MSMPISPSAPISSISLALGLSRGSSSKSPSTSLTSMQLFAPSSSAIRNAPVSVRRDQPEFRRVLVEPIWRCAVDNGQETEVEQSREIEEIAGFDSRASPPGKQQADHNRVLLANLGSQFGQHTSRHAEIDANVHYVPDPHSAAGNDKNLVLLRKLRDFLQERQDHIATVIDDPMPSNLDYI